MLEVLTILCACTATWMWIAPRTPEERLHGLRPQTCTPAQRARVAQDASGGRVGLPHGLGPPGTPERRIDRRTVIWAACTGLVAGLLVGGLPGMLAAPMLAAVAGLILHRRERPESQRDRVRIAIDLPFAADLMVACLQAGQPVSSATEIAANAVGGPLGQRLSWVSGQLRLGADPEPTWRSLSREPAMGQLSRAMSRAAQSGAPVADVLTRLADDARQATRAASVAAARRVGVQAVAPLGLCFLPAFVLLGIIPVVAGLARDVLIP